MTGISRTNVANINVKDHFMRLPHYIRQPTPAYHLYLTISKFKKASNIKDASSVRQPKPVYHRQFVWLTHTKDSLNL